MGFKFEDKPFDVLAKEYVNVKGSLNWWCNNNKIFFKQRNGDSENDGASMFDINRYCYLKEFLISNPPTFSISNKCCDWAKKKVNHRVMRTGNFDLSIIGVRKAEGGIRASAYKNCYTSGEDKIDQYRPLFWFRNDDKEVYEKAFGINHSDCYCKWGFKRTGCVCCPYGRELAYELGIVKKYEPNLYKAVNTVFKESYEYTKQYRQFVRDMKDKEKGRRKLF